MKNLKWLLFLLLTLISISKAANNYCNTPPSITAGVNPNVLIILDNSNSMDEDFYGNAVGSFSSASKMVVAKKTLISIIQELKDKLRIGLMTFKLSNNVSSYYIHNSPYFVSYEPKSYCPNPPPECEEYCKTGNLSAKTICSSDCKSKNPSFDVDYFDEIITYYSIGSEQRNRYCHLVYPKTQRAINPTDTNNYIYFKQALPFYSSSNAGNGFCYSSSYNPKEGSPYDSYSCYGKKTGTSDTFNGYSNFKFSSQFFPTDSDIALGYYDFGRRLSWWYVGRTWFSNTSPGSGYLHVKIDNLIDSNGNTTSTYNNLLAKLDPKENDENGYMSCGNSDKNSCPYIISAGLTPTAGTFKTAIDYFTGTNSPIQYRCQKTFIVFITDGLPSTDENGNSNTADNLMPAVLSKIDTLRNLTVNIKGTNYNFDIKTYVLGVGLTDDAKIKLDSMAVHGGTDVNGHAYYADNPEQLAKALNQIFRDILNKVSSSSTVAVITGSRSDNGALVEQVVFYPEKDFGNNYKVTWISKLITLWNYKSYSTSNIREDTINNFKLDLTGDKAISYDLDNNGNLVIKKCSVNPDGSTNTSDCQTYSGDIDKNNINYLIDVGEKLKDRSYSDRTIYSIDENGNFKLFTSSNASYFDTLLGTNKSEFPSCLKDSNDNIKYGDLIDYILGKQISGCRNRKVDNDGNTWKLADIMNSSPRIVHYDNYDVVYTASNDGILHAFKLGKYESLNGNPVAQLTGSDIGKELWGFIPKNALPYLRYLADPNYCHIYLNDLTPYIFNSISGKKILIGGFRLGGGCGYKCSGDQNNCSNPVNPPSDTCSNPSSSSCVGLSSYYALDITDPENPQFLWEFTDKDLGFAYSGPGLIRTKENNVDKEYIIFASGMHNYSAQFANNENDRKLKIYVLDSNTGELKRTIDTGIQKAFGGRIFSDGLDFDGDGYTDYIAFGYTRQDGSNTNFKGGIILLGGGKQGNNVYPFKNASSVNDWSFNNYTSLGTDINPVTTKVEFMKCFDRWYIYFGTGRWFKKDDDWEVNKNTLFGVPFDIKSDNNGQYIDFLTGTQDVTNESHVSNICTQASNNVIRGWYINLDPADSNSLKEKNISDPVVTTQNLVIFTTTKPNSDLCGFGGNTRVWVLNCATGGKPSGCDNGLYQVSNPGGTLLLQLSGGNIAEVNIANLADRVSNWYKGTPPEGASPFVPAASVSNTGGRFILWIEK